jgi:antitoxin ParD1/3/4
MPTMNISLPDVLKNFVEEQVSSGKYSSVSEYMRELVRAEQKNHEREKIELKLLEGLHSGEPVELSPDMWDGLRRRLRTRAKKAV